MVIYPVSARLKPEGTVQSCCVTLGSITFKSKYYFGGLRQAYLPTLQVFFLLEPSLIPAGISLRTLSFSPTKLDTPLSQLSFGCGKLRYMYLYKGEPQWSGLLLTFVLLLHALTN